MIVAKICWDHLTPAARKAAEELVADPNNPATHRQTTEVNQDFYTAATWLDDIRPTGRKLHYTDIPIRGDGTVPDGDNSVSSLKRNIALLGSDRATQDQKVEALRRTMHLVGDTHQPLHDMDHGDRGGNEHKLDRGHNLHQFWDTAGGSWPRIPRPLDGEGREMLGRLASGIESRYTPTDLATAAADLDPEHWVREGWELARADAYEGIHSHQELIPDLLASKSVTQFLRKWGVPGDEYRIKVQDDMEKEAALGGYRFLAPCIWGDSALSARRLIVNRP